MIKGVHAMFYSPKAEEVREFLRDKLGLGYTDTGDNWLIFDTDRSEVASHPSDRNYHEISFYCDDLEATVTELKERGVEFTSDINEEDWGKITRMRLPDGSEVDLYQPKYTAPKG